MRDFRIRTDLERHKVGRYALPLGVEPDGLPEPIQGYTIRYEEGGGEGAEDSPDTYAFHVVVTHERLKEVIDAAFGFLPGEVTPVVEIGSRDAYRSVDIYLSEEPLPLDDFLRIWYEFEEIILEDVCIGAGANAEEPFVEVFVDTWKGVMIHVPTEFKERVEAMLERLGLEEVAETWPDTLERDGEPLSKIREVLAIEDDHSPDLDEVLLQLREAWDLGLNVDPESNLDDAGRELGRVLWHAIVMAEPAEGDPEAGAYISFWATAGSITDIEGLVEDWFEAQDDWVFKGVYSMDRVAFDERPEELSSLPHRRVKDEVHLVHVDAWGDGPPTFDGGRRPESGSGGPPGGGGSGPRGRS